MQRLTGAAGAVQGDGRAEASRCSGRGGRMTAVSVRARRDQGEAAARASSSQPHAQAAPRRGGACVRAGGGRACDGRARLASHARVSRRSYECVRASHDNSLHTHARAHTHTHARTHDEARLAPPAGPAGCHGLGRWQARRRSGCIARLAPSAARGRAARRCRRDGLACLAAVRMSTGPRAGLDATHTGQTPSGATPTRRLCAGVAPRHDGRAPPLECLACASGGRPSGPRLTPAHHLAALLRRACDAGAYEDGTWSDAGQARSRRTHAASCLCLGAGRASRRTGPAPPRARARTGPAGRQTAEYEDTARRGTAPSAATSGPPQSRSACPFVAALPIRRSNAAAGGGGGQGAR